MTQASSGDNRLFFPAAQRNRDAILAVLARVLPTTGTILEIASGSGEHIVHFASRLPDLAWQPSDPDPDNRTSIAAWTAETGVKNVAAPLEIDVTAMAWGGAEDMTPAAILCCNMIHIAPWACTLGLFAGAGRILSENALLYLYGPFKRAGEHTAQTNALFDQSLRAQNPDWGLRDLEAVEAAANAAGLELEDIIEMPANNLSVLFRRR